MGRQLNALMFKFEQPGDKLTGTVTAVEKDWEIPNSENDGKCNRYHLLDDDGVTNTCILGTATDKSLEGVDLIGMKISIEFKGKVAIKGGAQQVNQFIVTDESDSGSKGKKSKNSDDIPF